MTFGAWLRAQRQALGLTQEELAGLTGIAQGMVSEYERGRRFPAFQDCVALAYELQADVYELTTRMLKERLLATDEGRILLAEFRAGRFYDDPTAHEGDDTP